MFAIFITFTILCFIILLITISRYSTSEDKGFKGEHTVRNILSKLPQRKYRTLNNILLPTRHGTTEIDHIVISRYAIYVIETKNYNGAIYGGEHSPQWHHYIGKHHHTFHNPTHQNGTHIRAINHLLRRHRHYNIPIISIIAFSPAATLRTECHDTIVINWNQLLPTITSHSKTNISSATARDILNIISTANITSPTARKQHIKSLKSKHH